MQEAATALRTVPTAHNPAVPKLTLMNINGFLMKKLYADNDFVNEHKLSRHCIGLSGMKFSDEEIEELAKKSEK